MSRNKAHTNKMCVWPLFTYTSQASFITLTKQHGQTMPDQLFGLWKWKRATFDGP